MPYTWKDDRPDHRVLHAWPHQSMTPGGFVLFIAVTSALLAVPLVPLIGSVVLWGILPFMLCAVAGVWWALKRSWRDNQILEVLNITPDVISLTRHNPRHTNQSWDCQSYWATAQLHATGGPVPQYLTLRGNGREVEIGRFLSVDERKTLFSDISDRLHATRAT